MESEHSNVDQDSESNPDSKVMADLDTLSDQIKLCNEMLKEQGGRVDFQNDAFLGVIGFLEACAPRMVELVEAATQGVLRESTLEKCLEINDRLLKVLSDCDNESKGSNTSSGIASAPAAAPVAAAVASSNLDVDLDDLLLDDTPEYKKSAKSGPGAYTGATKSDPFGNSDLLVPTPLNTKTPPVEEDEFDAFLQGRTEKLE